MPGETALGKNVIEHMLATAARTGVPLQRDNGNVSALRRPLKPIRQTRNRDPVRPTTAPYRPD